MTWDCPVYYKVLIWHAQVKTIESFRFTRFAGGVTGVFFWGGKVIFPDFFPGVKCFFPVGNSHFGRPKTNFRRFQKWKAKQQQQQQKCPHLFLITFPTSLLQFSLFLLNFHPLSLFSLPLFFPMNTSTKISRSEISGDTLPPPRLLRHCVLRNGNVNVIRIQ